MEIAAPISGKSKIQNFVGAWSAVFQFQVGRTEMAFKSKQKGNGYEREIANALKKIFPNARRLLENHKDDANGVDLLHTGHYRIQCKRYKAYAPISKIEEVQYSELMGEVPILITRGNSKPSLVVMPLEEFIRLLKNDCD